MGISRIYVGAHWFSDTLGAYLIGSVWLLFIVKIRPKLIDFLFKKSE
jgi:membrane-associated phospholipid phosphatase